MIAWGRLCLLIAGSNALLGCSVTALGVDRLAVVMDEARLVLEGETDVDFAAAAIPGNLKLLEVLLHAQPQQPTLLLLLAQGYQAYAFGFLEGQAEVQAAVDPALAAATRRRAFDFYMRARGFGLRALALSAPELSETLKAFEDPSAQQLVALTPSEVSALFAVAAPWALGIHAQKSNPAMLIHLGTVRRLLERCIELDEAHAFAAPHVAMGALEAGLPLALGGKAEKARRHFARASELTKRHNLMARVLDAKMVGIQTGDRDYFERLLHDVLASDPDGEPALALANRLAQRRAAFYLQSIDAYFL